jgi:hypothetical protein
MVKVNLKNKFAFLNRSRVIETNTSTLELEENIDTNAIWFQSMEPVTYAKKNGSKLYKLKKIRINYEASKDFKYLLLTNLKKQLDHFKKK